MNRTLKTKVAPFIFLFMLSPLSGQGTLTDLRLAGHAIFPCPQKVELNGESTVVDNSWQLVAEEGSSQSIRNELIRRSQELHGLDFSAKGSRRIELRISPTTVTGISDPACSAQAYRISISPQKILIEGNEEMGLFYGIQSFMQLLKPVSYGVFKLPTGTITDWPDLKLRVIHWDTKHHREKMETLKRYIDWLAYFKVNAIAFELEDKYAYPSHPIIAGPNAFSRKEMEELTRYAKEHFIQLIPSVQAPAHMGYVLKHEEFAHLRADQESNYQACMCNEEAMDLIFDMYQDLIDATPGVDYFFVSTDEVYYAGICDQCEKEYTAENRSQTWVDYLNRVNRWMNKRGRRVMAWVEFPLLTEHITKLDQNIIDGIMGSPKSQDWVDEENKAGIEQLAYNSMQGEELLFPNYFPTLYRGRRIIGRLNDVFGEVTRLETRGANIIGSFAAAWDDAGLHSETFWLGWATVTQYAWTKSTPELQQSTADFMNLFYGYGSQNMTQIYRTLEEGARYYQALWDKVPSKEREKGYGSSFGKGIGADMIDLTLQMPPLPSAPDLSLKPSFRSRYKQKIDEAARSLDENELLFAQLTENTTRVSHNAYNLEVLLALASLERYTMETVYNLARIEGKFEAASEAAGSDPEKAMDLLLDAHKLSEKILRNKEIMWSCFNASWYKSRLPKNQSRNGIEYLYVLDDVKDHFADRRKGLEYMLAPFERMKIEEWKMQLEEVINEYARTHDMPPL